MLKRKDVFVLLTVPLMVFGGVVITISIGENGISVEFDNPFYDEDDDSAAETTQTTIGDRPQQPRPDTEAQETTTTTQLTTNFVETENQETETTIESTTYTTTYETDITEMTVDYDWQDVTQEQVTQTQETHEEVIQQSNDTISITEGTEETVCTQTITLPRDYQEDYVNDAIIIKDECIAIAYGPATQINVDSNDVLQDTELFSSSNVTYFFGHNFRSFGILNEVEVGEIITVRNYGEEVSYKVDISGEGELVNGGMDIKLFDSGQYVVNNQYEKESIVLITCASVFRPNDRWVIIASVE